MIELDILHSIKPIEVEGAIYSPHKGEEGVSLPDRLGKAMIKRGWATKEKVTFLTVKGAELKAVAQWLKGALTISGSKVGDNGITTHFVDAANIYGGRVFTPAEWISRKDNCAFAFDSERLTKCLWTCKKGEEIDIKVRPSTLEIRDKDGRQWLHKLPGKEEMRYIKDTKQIKTGSIKVFLLKQEVIELKKAIAAAVKEGKGDYTKYEDLVFVTEGEEVGIYVHGYGGIKKVYSVYTGEGIGESVAVYSLDMFLQVLKGVKPGGKTEGLKIVYDEGYTLKATFKIGSSTAVVYMAGKTEERREDVRKVLTPSSSTVSTEEEVEAPKEREYKEAVDMFTRDIILVQRVNPNERPAIFRDKEGKEYPGNGHALSFDTAFITQVKKEEERKAGEARERVYKEAVTREGEIVSVYLSNSLSDSYEVILKDKEGNEYSKDEVSFDKRDIEQVKEDKKAYSPIKEEESEEVKQLKNDIRIDEETLEKAEKEEEALEPEAGEEEIFNADAPRLEEDIRQAKAELDKIQEQEKIEHEKYLARIDKAATDAAEQVEREKREQAFKETEQAVKQGEDTYKETTEEEGKTKARQEVVKVGVSFLTVREASGTAFHNSKEVYEDMKPEAQIDRECMWVLHLSGGKVLKKELVAMGKGNAAYTTPREVFRRAIIEGATKIIMVHNHPSGDPTPSDADISTCEDYVKAGELLGIDLLDFLVIGTQGYTSFADKGIGGF